MQRAEHLRTATAPKVTVSQPVRRGVTDFQEFISSTQVITMVQFRAVAGKQVTPPKETSPGSAGTKAPQAPSPESGKAAQ